MKNTIIKRTIGSLLSLTIIVLSSQGIQAQVKVGNNPTTINASSVIEMESSNKGMLLPRIALSATNTPTLAGGSHVAGMVVYNTATAGSGATAVTPGYYYNDGSQWVRLAAGGNGGNVSLPVTNLVSNNSPVGNTPGQLLYNNNPNIGLPVGPVYWDGNNWVPINPTATEPWYNVATNAGATANTQNIYQMGNVGIGTTTPTQRLTIGGAGDVLGVDNASGFSARNAAGVYEGFLTPRWNDDIMYMNYGANGFNIRNNSMVPTMFMTNAGNVGIGTTSPTSKLDVALPGGSYIRASGNDGDLAGGFGYSFYIRNNNHEFARINGEYGDSNSGGAGGISFSTLNYGDFSKRMLIAANGNVGIGTTSPTTNLHVIGIAKIGGTATHSGYIEFERTGQAFRDGYLGYGNTTNGGLDLISEVANKPLKLSTNSGNIILIPGNGNVGIGTDTPGAKLEIAGQVKITGGTPGVGKILTSDATGLATWEAPASGADGDAWGVTGEDQASAIFRAGNVGIGTAPRESFDIRKGIAFHTGGNLAMFFNGYYDGGFKHAGYGGSNYAGVLDFGAGTGDMYFKTSEAAGAEGTAVVGKTLLSLKQSGNVGIGTTNPATLLEVSGSTTPTLTLRNTSAVGGEGTAKISFNIASGVSKAEITAIDRTVGAGGAWNGALAFNTSDNGSSIERMRINEYGNVGIGTITPEAKLDVAGTMKVETPGSDAQRTLLLLESNTWATTPNQQASYLIRAGEGTKSGALGSFAVRGDGQSYFSGNVGIGTTAPATSLDLAGKANGGRLLLSTQGYVEAGATGGSITVDNIIDKTLMIVGANFGASPANSGLGQREVSLWDNVTVNGRLRVRGGGAGAGKVLTSDADGLASWSDPATLSSTNIYNSDGALTGARTLTQGANALTFDGAGNFIKMGGKVGIGTSTPLARLHVVGFAAFGNATAPGTWTSNGSDIILNTGAANSEIFLRPNGDGNSKNQFRLRPQTGHSFFGFDGLEKVRIDTTGNVGIGTTSPASTLQVAGSFATAIGTITADYTATVANHTILCNTTAGGFTLTLPAANTAMGRMYVIRKTDESNNVLTFSTPIKLSETSTFTTLNYLKTIRIQSDGSSWVVID